MSSEILDQKVKNICQRIVEFSKNKTTVEEEESFFEECFKEVSEYFSTEKDFFLYLIHTFKENKDELLKSKQ